MAASVQESLHDPQLQAQGDQDVQNEEEEEIDAEQQEQEALRALEAECSDREMIMGFSDEEDILQKMASRACTRVKSFERDAFLRLQARGVTTLPPSRAHLGYHHTSRTWQGYWDGTSQGLCFSFGGSTKRSEPEALLMVLKRLIMRYVEAYPRDVLWQLQLKKIQELESSVADL